METKQIVMNLLKVAENKQVKNVKIKSVTVTDMDNYTRLGLRLDKPVSGFVPKDDGTYEKGETDIIFVSTYAVGGMLREDDDCSFAVNHLNENPKAYALILTGATVDIVQQYVKEGEIYINPFSSNQDPDGLAPQEHDIIINHIVSCKLTDKAKAMIDKLAEKMLGF